MNIVITVHYVVNYCKEIYIQKKENNVIKIYSLSCDRKSIMWNNFMIHFYFFLFWQLVPNLFIIFS